MGSHLRSPYSNALLGLGTLHLGRLVQLYLQGVRSPLGLHEDHAEAARGKMLLDDLAQLNMEASKQVPISFRGILEVYDSIALQH